MNQVLFDKYHRLLQGFNGCSDEFPFFDAVSQVKDAAFLLSVELPEIEGKHSEETFDCIKRLTTEQQRLDERFPDFPYITKTAYPERMTWQQERDYQLKGIFETPFEELTPLSWAKLAILIELLKEGEQDA